MKTVFGKKWLLLDPMQEVLKYIDAFWLFLNVYVLRLDTRKNSKAFKSDLTYSIVYYIWNLNIWNWVYSLPYFEFQSFITDFLFSIIAMLIFPWIACCLGFLTKQNKYKDASKYKFLNFFFHTGQNFKVKDLIIGKLRKYSWVCMCVCIYTHTWS